jgi:hypothetical protein
LTFSIVDLIPLSFDFFEPGGPAHLLPGRPLEQTRSFTRPRGSGFFITLSTISGAFVHPDGRTLTQRPLGQFLVTVGVRSPDTIVCRVRLTDENMDDAVSIQVRGALVLIA